MQRIKKFKWFINWIVFVGLLAVFVFLAITFENKPWIGNMLQTIGTITGVYLTLIIFFRSKEDSDKQFRDQIEHLQNLNAKQIEALHSATEKQILAFQNFTDRQIEALHKSTSDEISSYERQTREVVKNLSDNSILIGELLCRELETSMNANNKHYCS